MALNNFKHGATIGRRQTVEYQTWKAIIQRCENPNHISYPWYGARGVRMCAAWRRSFLTFLRDMGPRPGDGYSIERRSNKRPYSKGNCYWLLRRLQPLNQSRVRKVRIDGEVVSLKEACRRRGIAYHTVRSRLKRGMSLRLALKKETRL